MLFVGSFGYFEEMFDFSPRVRVDFQIDLFGLSDHSDKRVLKKFRSRLFENVNDLVWNDFLGVNLDFRVVDLDCGAVMIIMGDVPFQLYLCSKAEMNVIQ